MEFTPLQKTSFLALRIMSSLIFIMAGLNHLFKTAGAAARLESAAMGGLATWIASAETLVILSGVGLLLGGLMLLMGYKTKLAALLLITILVPITLTIQIGNPEGAGPLFKNIAILGVLTFFAVNGAVYYGLDQKLKGSFAPMQARSAVLVASFGLMFLLGACTTTNSIAQTTTKQTTAATAKQKYAVLISQPDHLKAAVNTAETITKENKYDSEAFVIMACGKSVQAFVKGGEMAQVFEAGKKAGVTYRVCGMSLKKFDINPNTLMDGVEVVPNGLTHMFDLKLQGFTTVEL
ncbi:putative oxidoreductase [Pontibacter aydingkolensis]|uniref:DoxX family membrane protein n=1 Tax=Pontibacter aydingkolensis TaxID=1911536 RepID=A0ABS7CW35_9BACT|nr:DoxX family membrane protein [Pontibacter aydingkolensis]MBW7468000.1 DoxX family membrane protein [Pontibacter aydingkolensis]